MKMRQLLLAVGTGDREPQASDQLIAWTSKPTNVVDWKLDSLADAGRFKVSVRPNGGFVAPTAIAVFLR